MKLNRPSRRERGELPIWRLVIVALLGNTVRVLILGYIVCTVYLAATGGFKGWW